MSSGTRHNNQHSNLWETSASPGPQLTALQSAVRSDVTIIGAGIAGLSTALHLAETGVSVTVIEAESPGSGASGKSGGLVAPDFIRHLPSQIEQAFGAEAGSRLVEMIGSSARFCFDLIEKHGIDCQGSSQGFWTPAHNTQVVEALKIRAHEWQSRGFKVRFAERVETALKLGTRRYHGAVVFEEGGTLNPLAYSRELAARAIKFGAKIYNNSAALELTRKNTHWSVKTSQGTIESQYVILAANGGNSRLHSAMKNTVLPLNVIEYATAPLSPLQQAGILQNGESFTDKQPYVFSARFDEKKRLIAAFPDFANQRNYNTLISEAKTRIKLQFPALKDVEIQHLWPGRAWINTDLLPKIYALDEKIFAIQACNGRGIASNTAIGAEVSDAIVNEDFSRLSVRPEQPSPIKAYWAAQHAPSILMAMARFRNRFSTPSVHE